MPESETFITGQRAERTRVTGYVVTPQITHAAHAWRMPGVVDLMHFLGSIPMEQHSKCLEKESFVLPHTDVMHHWQHCLGTSLPVCTAWGPWSHSFQEFGQNHRLLIINNCHCSAVRHPRPSAHGTTFFGINTVVSQRKWNVLQKCIALQLPPWLTLKNWARDLWSAPQWSRWL